jgi:alginate O-acetyltransferase complex protein AlgJ
MSDENVPPARSEPPRPPTRSLPSYSEPTPETHRKVSRETEAELALKNSLFAPGLPSALTVFFLITIAAVPIIQLAAELRTSRSVSQLPSLTAFGSLIPHRSQIHSVAELWQILPQPDQIKSVQKTLERESVVAQWLLPGIESLLTGILRTGNEQAYLGRDDWLFYRPDVDYVIGPPFLDPFWIKRRKFSAGVQPDAVKAIVDFRNQLAERSIDLIVAPTPVKPSIGGHMLAFHSNAPRFENGSFGRFKAELEHSGVHVFDPEPLLIGNILADNALPYLKADTHWRPEAMESVARELAKQIGICTAKSPFGIVDKRVRGLGDIARMLKLPREQLERYTEEVTIHQVRVGNALWQASKSADVLLLGDSFSNVFSLDALGWGESAGLAEHLSSALGRPIDCILRNSDGAFATREMLSRELARGRDRLAEKKVVVWQFAARELAFGDWKLIKMAVGQARPAAFFVPPPGRKLDVIGTVESVSRVPVPGSAPYADHIMAVHLTDIADVPGSESQNPECLVYLWSMRDNVWTKAARLRPGDRVWLKLQPWSDVSAQLEKINHSEIEDPAVQLEEPCWGELVN